MHCISKLKLNSAGQSASEEKKQFASEVQDVSGQQNAYFILLTNSLTSP